VRALRTIAALSLALAVQTTLTGLFARGTDALDLVLVVVVYVGLTAGPISGLAAGTVAGLVQDALSSGILGIGSLAKTVVGYLAGVVGTQFIVTAAVPRFIVFAAATALHGLLFMGAYVLLDLRSFPAAWPAMATQAVANGVVGVLATKFVDWWPRFVERRRAVRAHRLKR
jgi:rod shape-determining protein MreD